LKLKAIHAGTRFAMLSRQIEARVLTPLSLCSKYSPQSIFI